MAGISTYLATALLNAVFNGTPLAVGSRYAQLHVGDPGPLCLLNPAQNTQRLTLNATTTSSTTWYSNNALVWTVVPASEVYTHLSIWDAPTGGNALWSGPLTQPEGVNANDSFTLSTNAVAVTAA